MVEADDLVQFLRDSPMTAPEILPVLTRVSIWLAVAAWTVVVAMRTLGRGGSITRLIWTVGLGAFLIHVVAAFAGFYENSHAVALAETARQTAEITGFRTGIGLWVNYLLGALWLADVARWWITGRDSFSGFTRWPARFYHGFFAFMVFNGTIVFGNGAVRWFGFAVFAILAAVALRARLRPEN